MAFGMSIIMGGVKTAFNTGIDNEFLERYFNSFVIAFPVAIIAAFTMAPVTKILVNKIASK